MNLDEIKAINPRPREITVSEQEWFALAREIDNHSFQQGNGFSKAWESMVGTAEMRLFGILVKRDVNG